MPLSPRDPKHTPRPGDVLLEAGSDHPIVVGKITAEGEVKYGKGDHRYYFDTIEEWRENHKDSRVLYTSGAEVQ